MGFFDYFANKIADSLSDSLASPLSKEIEKRRAYRAGDQKKNLKHEQGKPDDNITINLCGLVVNKSAALLFGKGITFDIDVDTPEGQYLTELWDANKQQIFLSSLATVGAESGTCYIRIIPDGMIGNDGNTYPRLLLLDPAYVEIDTSPEDIDDVTEYEIKYRIVVGGKEIDRKVEFEREESTWLITTYERSDGTHGKWQEIENVVWSYPFAPIVHWQNLPRPFSVYGEPDLTDDVTNLQDKYNLVMSNINKVIRLYAHPMRYSRGAGAGELDISPGKMPNFNSENGGLFQLEPLGDLQSSIQDAAILRQSLFSITQSVDLSSMQDKIGSLTNFGLRLLYQDALARIAVKQQLYGDAIAELNRRLLIIGGYAGQAVAVKWPDPLPVNMLEVVQTAQTKQALKLVSNETLAKELGYDYAAEQERMASDPGSEDNVGAFLLNQFNKGQ